MKKLVKPLKNLFGTKEKKNCFIVIGTQRSGTTYLGDLLSSHEQIHMGQELFKVEKNKINVDDDNYGYFLKEKSVDKFLDDFYEKRLTNNNAAGFKIMLNHMERFPEVLEYIHKKKIKCIYLERANQLKIALSRLKARKTQVYHSTEPIKHQSLKIDPDNLLTELHTIRESVEKLRQISKQAGCYELTYESLVKDKNSEMKYLLEYLDVSYAEELESSLNKINSDTISDIVSNYDEIKEILYHTEFAKYLDEDKKMEKPLITVFANYNYLHVLENWLAAMRRIHVDNFLIISLDEKLHHHLQEKNISSLFRPCEFDLGKLWIHRVDIILELLEKGYNIIHSDADAVWIKDPQPYLNKLSQDMIFSQGTYWPLDVHKKWKFVLCCGFFYIKSNKKTLDFMNQLAERVQIDKDDQVSCNRLLMEEGLSWNIPENTYKLTFRDRDFICSTKCIFGKTDTLSAALLPHAKFQRIAEPSDDVYVKHLISEKNSDDIMEVLAENKCKFI